MADAHGETRTPGGFHDLWTAITEAAVRSGSRATVIDEDETLTLGELLDRARRIAGGLARDGLKPGDTVLIQSRNCIDAFAAILACFAGGFVAAPLPPIFSVRQVAAVASNTKARGMILLDGDAIQRPDEVADAGAEGAVVFVRTNQALGDRFRPWSACQSASAAPLQAVDPYQLAFVLHSSGSMGEPKGVMHSQHSLSFAMNAIASRHAVRPADTILVALEFGFVGGTVLGGLLAMLIGARAVLMRKWSPEAALDLIERYKVSYGLLMPTHCLDVLKCDRLNMVDTRSLTRLVMAGIPRDARIDAAKRFCRAPLGMFGMSEAIGHCTPAPDDPEEALLTTDGRPLDGSEVRIVGSRGEPLPAGCPGELLLRGPNRFLGYLGRPDLDREVIMADGWFRTGDIAVVDDRGFLTYIGREKNIIRRGGVTIIPSDLENVLSRHPSIAGVSVVGVPDERLGEKACACVVAKDAAEIDRAAVAAFLEQEDVPRYLWPEYVLEFDELPRTASLKVRRNDLQIAAIARLKAQRLL